MKKHFGEDKIILLFGAGASCDAGMKNSIQMINDIELQLEDKWKDYKHLYNYIQSSHYHIERLRGLRSADISFNIEHLVGLLNVIIDIGNRKIDLYPFIGSWEKDLLAVTGENFTLARSFKEKILQQLKTNWLMPVSYISKSSYYGKVFDTGYTFALRIFSLNYDMCVEKNTPSHVNLERGFNDARIWDYRRYEASDRESDFFLYKLHGSLDWKRENDRLTFADATDSIEPLELEIIFGVQNKLQSYDPYLFYFYAFREACIKAELIVISGYGFYDKHINDNLEKAIIEDPDKKVLVNLLDSNREEEDIKKWISQKIRIKSENLIIANKPAKDFFTHELNVNYFASLFPESDSEANILPTVNDSNEEVPM